MVIYNVTIKVDSSIIDDWLKWMKDEHIPDVVGLGLFTEGRLCKLLEQDETDGSTYVAQYFCKSMAEYNTYISEYSQEMREKGFAKFGNKFLAFRTVMEVLN
ncbi:MAG: DUF4286 family protein [Bacteroidetes bacterium]|nr:DUF4286 family protein [Bacteroidota bacterium]